MIWATVSSQSFFCWLCRACPSLVAKNISNLISVLTIWWCPCGVFSCFVERGYLLWSMLGKTPLKPLSCFILCSKAKFACYSRYLLISYFCIPVSYNEEDIFWVLVLEGLVGLHRTVQFQLLQHYWLGHRLGLLWCWMVCLWKELRSFCHF